MENWAEMESVYAEDVKTKGWLSDICQSGRQSNPDDLGEGGYLFTTGLCGGEGGGENRWWKEGCTTQPLSSKCSARTLAFTKCKIVSVRQMHRHHAGWGHGWWGYDLIRWFKGYFIRIGALQSQMHLNCSVSCRKFTESFSDHLQVAGEIKG